MNIPKFLKRFFPDPSPLELRLRQAAKEAEERHRQQYLDKIAGIKGVVDETLRQIHYNASLGRYKYIISTDTEQEANEWVKLLKERGLKVNKQRGWCHTWVVEVRW